MSMPYLTVLSALFAEVDAALAGKTIDGQAITVRHHRFRNTSSREMPCVAPRMISADPSATFGQAETQGGLPEQMMELAVNLVVDLEIDPEDDDPKSLAGDPTGYGRHAQVLAWILDRLLPDLEGGAEPNTLGGTVWDIRYDGTAPEDAEMSPDVGRMEERLTLFYRVRADHPTVLLES
jgi:hypothetical protein